MRPAQRAAKCWLLGETGYIPPPTTRAPVPGGYVRSRGVCFFLSWGTKIPQTHKGGGISTGGADFPEKQPKGPDFGRPPPPPPRFPITASLSRPSIEAPNPHCYWRLWELARACPCGCVASVGGVFLVWPGRKTRPARHAARVLPRCPAAAPPVRRLLKADAGGNASAPSSPRKVATDQDSCSAASAEQMLIPQTLIGA